MYHISTGRWLTCLRGWLLLSEIDGIYVRTLVLQDVAYGIVVPHPPQSVRFLSMFYRVVYGFGEGANRCPDRSRGSRKHSSLERLASPPLPTHTPI